MEVVPPEPAARQLLTARLRLVAADRRLATALADFHGENEGHLAPWDPPADADVRSPAVQAERLDEAAAAFSAGTGYRYLMQPIGDPAKVIGTVHFSNVLRGAFQSATLGFALAQAYEGQALMNEALRTAIAEMFSPRVNLHRIQAAFRPENWRSGEVLRRLGFADEGVAPDYLYIDGSWRVHRIVSLLNPAFVEPEAWHAPGR